MFCQKCGKEIPEGMTICMDCSVPQQPAPVPVQKPENVLTAIVGAVLGAALGGLSIVLLGQIGYVASISGVILAVCTLKGYELLGGRLNTRGIVICCALMLVMPYLADRINWALEIVEVFGEEGVTFDMAFAAVHDVVAELELQGDYVADLAMLYGFTALGAFGTLKGLFKKK